MADSMETNLQEEHHALEANMTKWPNQVITTSSDAEA